jgi:DNA-binding LytR/AlgR family response regulator
MNLPTLKCILLDDELPGLTYLKMLCEQIPGIEVVKAFNNPLKLVEESPAIDFDLCILDIEMPGMNGLEVAKKLKHKAVIFTTAYKDYAAEAFDLDAIDYIKKPIQKERLEKSILKAKEKISSGKRTLEYAQLNTNKGKVVLFFDQVAFLTTAENDTRDKLAFLANGTRVHLKNISFDQLLEIFPPHQFCRVNKKDIVSVKHLRHYTSHEITVWAGEEHCIALGEIYKASFRKMVY